ncbi:MAG: reverse transcriptase family protein [Myxococcota bacterium]|jgi:retron-type reverse transcriptase|nr:reverse transcriptase family protein [Myxococcota bacterium]
MSFWDKLKRFFGGGDDDLDLKVREVALGFVDAGEQFSATGVASRAVGIAEPALRKEAEARLHALFERGGLPGYARTEIAGMWLYHPEGVDPRGMPGAPVPPRPPTPSASTSTSTSSSGGWKPPKERASTDPYDTSGTLTLTPEQLRERAKKIVPWRTAWIGRVDVIPPASDERTALIDRGFVLRGLLTQEDLDEIHRIGDLWLEHHDSARMAHASGKKSADEAIEARRRERAEKKAAKKAEAAKKKAARAEAIATRRATDVIFLGEGVSSQLHDRRAENERLEAFGLPVIVTPEQLAAHLGVTVPRLRWLAFHQEAAQTTHYVQFEVPKRTGGTRVLAAPKADIAAAQTTILETILAKLPLDEAAHGFVTGRSTVTNARPHQGRDLVINLDLSDFFPSVTFPRVRGVFRSFGYSPAIATILALLCTESPRRPLTYDGRSYEVAVGPRALPQGACTSPALSNLVARKLDRRLRGLATKHGLTYTRYADDLTFSATAEKRSELGMMLARMRHVIEDEGFALNPKKVRVQRKGGRQTVTGIVVNEPTKLGLPRTEVRRLRAILHAARIQGLQSQNRERHPDFRAHLAGKIAYLAMIDPARAKPLREALDACRS